MSDNRDCDKCGKPINFIWNAEKCLYIKQYACLCHSEPSMNFDLYKKYVKKEKLEWRAIFNSSI